MKLTSLIVTCLLAGSTAWGQFTYKAYVDIDPTKQKGAIAPEIYGQYLEHVQESEECIYPSIWDDQSKLSNEWGLRRDVITAAKELGVPVVRWPGGCFADVYHWENGIGPREQRPTLPNLHWQSMESNQFGTDEFLRWSLLVGNRPYVNVNLGTGTLAEALRWLEYCNGSVETEQGKRRAANGHAAPYAVPFWGIGNETWGSWEAGWTDEVTYSKLLAEWAQAMKQQDPSIQLLAVGSNAADNPAWDLEVLKRAGSWIDYLTLHIYGSSFNEPVERSYEAVVHSPRWMEAKIKTMLGVIDAAKEKFGLKHDIRISVDEWNIRRFENATGDFGRSLRRKAPRNMEDAMFVAGCLNVMVRHSPRVGMANYVFLVNGHAPLLVNGEQVVKTPLFHVFQQYGKWMSGTALDVEASSPEVEVPMAMTGSNRMLQLPEGKAPPRAQLLDSAAALHEDGTLVVSLINRHAQRPADVTLALPEGYRISRSWVLSHEDAKAANDFEHPNKVVPVTGEVKDANGTWLCQPRSVVLLSCTKED